MSPSPSPRTCRHEVLDAVHAIVARKGPVFGVADVLGEMHARGTQYADSTIRTHVTSRMCANAPDHQAVTYPDLVRVGPGRYRLARS
jgi:hypothetical protein